MADNASVPYMSDTHVMDMAQYGSIEVVQLSNSILSNRTSHLASGVAVAEKAGEYLIDYYLLIHNYEG